MQFCCCYLKPASLTLDRDPNFANTVKLAMQCSFHRQLIQIRERTKTVVVENPLPEVRSAV